MKSINLVSSIGYLATRTSFTMRRIVVLTIFFLAAITYGVKAQSTWDRPWSGAQHSYMASVRDPENDNPVRWYVATNPSGTKKAVYNTDYTFITPGYNAGTGMLEGTALYVIEIAWGANLTDKTDFYVVIEVDDKATNCTNRKALHVQTQSIFNAFLSDMVANPSCPDDAVDPIWNGEAQADIGNSELIFQIGRQNTQLDWQFEYEVSESSVLPFSIDSIRFVDDLGKKLSVMNQAVDFKTGEVIVDAINNSVLAYVYIRNQMGVTLNLNFDLITENELTKDASDHLDADFTDNRIYHTIQSMPVITNFGGD